MFVPFPFLSWRFLFVITYYIQDWLLLLLPYFVDMVFVVTLFSNGVIFISFYFVMVLYDSRYPSCSCCCLFPILVMVLIFLMYSTERHICLSITMIISLRVEILHESKFVILFRHSTTLSICYINTINVDAIKTF